MKYIKMLGLAAVAAAALMAFMGVGTASATTLTDGSGNHPTAISAENGEDVILHPPIGSIECSHSTVSGSASTGGTGETVSGAISTLTFSSCNATVTVLKNGSLEIHGQAGNKGVLTSNGAEVTVEFFGFHCIFSTSNTTIGTVTGGTPAKLAIDADIPRTGGRSGAFCGSEAEWTGSYEVTSPSTVNIDA